MFYVIVLYRFADRVNTDHTNSLLSEAAGLNLAPWTRHILDENGPLCGALSCFLLLIKPIFRTTVTSGTWISTIYRISSAIVRSPGRSKSMSWRDLRELYLTRYSEFFTPELRDLVSHDYELKGNKRLRSLRTLPDNDWILSKIGTAIINRTSSIRGMSCDSKWEVRNI
jgi:hypothetical protein